MYTAGNPEDYLPSGSNTGYATVQSRIWTCNRTLASYLLLFMNVSGVIQENHRPFRFHDRLKVALSQASLWIVELHIVYVIAV